MIFRQLGEVAGMSYFAPLAWWQTMWDAHFNFVDSVAISAAERMTELRATQLKLINGGKQ
jgi:hypothetical protein